MNVVQIIIILKSTHVMKAALETPDLTVAMNSNGGTPNVTPEHDELIRALGALRILTEHSGVKVEGWRDVYGDMADNADCADLATLFTAHGSDKSTKHNYDLVYASLLGRRRNEPLTIFEMGVGTTNPNIRANMGPNGKPGASLRAFRDWAPHASVYGADIERDILFNEERINTFFADQSNPETLAALAQQLPRKCDLLVDDGRHNPPENFNTLAFALPLMAKDGAVVVEDIVDRYLPLWQAAVATLSNRYTCRLVRMKHSTACIIQHKAHPGVTFSSLPRHQVRPTQPKLPRWQEEVSLAPSAPVSTHVMQGDLFDDVQPAPPARRTTRSKKSDPAP